MTVYTTFKAIQITFNTINLNIYITNFFVDCIVNLCVIFIDFHINVFIHFVNDCCVVSIDLSINIVIYFIDNSSIVSFNLIIDSFINYCIVFVDFISNCIFNICDLIANMTF